MINATSPLPQITTGMGIYGHSDGYADKVVLHGPGSGYGLDFRSVPAGAVYDMVINGFGTGIGAEYDSYNLTIAGNYIGTDPSGTSPVANYTGISLYKSAANIGGTSGVTPGGACTGDCNVISGNTGDAIFEHVTSESYIETIQGNHIGADVAGMSTLANGRDGISIDLELGFLQQQSPSDSVIGGSANGAGNLISGNGRYGINLKDYPVGIQGNLVGTDVSGTAAIPNGTGIFTFGIDVRFPIGGAGAGEANLISGNTFDGIRLDGTNFASILGNLIGTQIDGIGSLGNGGVGVDLTSSTHYNLIGGTGAGEGDTIAFNGSGGVVIGINDYDNQIRGDSIHDNTGKAIRLDDQQNGHASAPPVITGVGPVTGTACANCIVDVYSDDADEGSVFEGSTSAGGDGSWMYGGAVSGPNVTATDTASDPNYPDSLSTSEFSAPMALPATPTPSPSASPTPSASPSPTGTATATITASGTPAASLTPTPTPASRIQGDANCDGQVTDEDAVVILEESEALAGSCAQAQVLHFANDDVNCDGAVTAFDALEVLRSQASLAELALPAGCPTVGTALP